MRVSINSCAQASVFATALFCSLLDAKSYQLPQTKQLIGLPSTHIVQQGDYFLSISEIHNVGFLPLIAANPNVDPLLPQLETQITLPTQMILPRTAQVGIVVNLPELRLYYFEPEKSQVHVYPIGIGQKGHRTPVTRSFISQKRKSPDWIVPEPLRKRYLTEKNIVLPPIVPAGPDNPLGSYAMRLGKSEYLIHGTNQRFGIGLSVSSGCIRMFESDIEELFNRVELNTPVRIIDQPVKLLLTEQNTVYLEVHSPLEGSKRQLDIDATLKKLRHILEPAKIDESQLEDIFSQASGLPILLNTSFKNIEL